jgi:hypothetical protein
MSRKTVEKWVKAFRERRGMTAAIGSVMGRIQAATGVVLTGELAVHPAIGMARGVTAATRRSTSPQSRASPLRPW